MNPNSSSKRGVLITRLLVCVVMVLSILSGCAKLEPKTVTGLTDPEEKPAEETGRQYPWTLGTEEQVQIMRSSLDGRLSTGAPDRSISPDCKHLLAAVSGKTTYRIVAIPAGGNDDSSSWGEVTPDESSLYEIDTSRTQHNFVQLLPLGWISDSECVFAIHGWQDKGPHKGKRGTAIYTADIETGSTSLVSYLDVPAQGGNIREAVLGEGGTIYMRIAPPPSPSYSGEGVQGDFAKYVELTLGLCGWPM